MEIDIFCRGSRKLAIKYRYYLKYYIMIAISILTPFIVILLDMKNVVKVRSLRLSSIVVFDICLIWLVVLLVGLIGRNNITALQYQIFGITKDQQIIHFYFKELLLDGKVVLKFSPYHKKSIQNEFIQVVKRKEEIIKDPNFEEYLSILVKDKIVQKESDILFERMNDVQIMKEHRKYIIVTYTIGTLGTRKKLKIYKNVTNFNSLIELMKS